MNEETPPDQETSEPQDTPPSADSPASVPTEEPPESGKSKKPLIIIIILILILALAAGAGYFLLQEDDDDGANQTSMTEQTEQMPAEPVEKTVLNITEGTTKLQLDTDGNVSELSESAPDLSEGFDGLAFPVLSPDESKVVYFESGDDYPIESYVTIRDLATGDEQRLTEAWTDSHGPLAAMSWMSNDTFYLREHSCFECDGPALPIIWEISTAMEDSLVKEVLVDLSDKSEWQSAFSSVSPGSQYAAIVNAPAGLGGTIESYRSAPRELHIHNIMEDSSKVVYEITSEDQYMGSVIGWTEDQQEALVTVDRFFNHPTEGWFTTELDHLARINVDSGSVSKIPLELSELASEDGGFGRLLDAAIFNDELVFTTNVYNSDSDTFTNRLYSLPLDGGENPVNLLRTSSSSFDIGQSETITVQ